MAHDLSEREGLVAPHRIVYVNAGNSPANYQRDRSSRALLVAAVLTIAMCAAVVMLGSSEGGNVNIAEKGHGVVLSATKQQVLAADDDDDDYDLGEDDDMDDDEDGDDNEDEEAQPQTETEMKAKPDSPATSLATGDGSLGKQGLAEGSGQSKDEDTDKDEDKDADKDDKEDDEKEPEDFKDEDEDEAEVEKKEEKPALPEGCTTNAKDCVKTCLTEKSIEGSEVEKLMSASKGYAECFINTCEDKELPEGEKCKLKASEFDVCWQSLEDLDAEVMKGYETCTMQVSGTMKLPIDKYLNKYATEFD